MTVAKHVDFTSYGRASSVVCSKITSNEIPKSGKFVPCSDTPPNCVGAMPTKWFKPSTLCPIAKALNITSDEAVRLLDTACLLYAQGDVSLAQRYLFAALVTDCPIRSRPDPEQLAQAEETLKRLL